MNTKLAKTVAIGIALADTYLLRAPESNSPAFLFYAASMILAGAVIFIVPTSAATHLPRRRAAVLVGTAGCTLLLGYLNASTVYLRPAFIGFACILYAAFLTLSLGPFGGRREIRENRGSRVLVNAIWIAAVLAIMFYYLFARSRVPRANLGIYALGVTAVASAVFGAAFLRMSLQSPPLKAWATVIVFLLMSAAVEFAGRADGYKFIATAINALCLLPTAYGLFIARNDHV